MHNTFLGVSIRDVFTTCSLDPSFYIHRHRKQVRWGCYRTSTFCYPLINLLQVLQTLSNSWKKCVPSINVPLLLFNREHRRCDTWRIDTQYCIWFYIQTHFIMSRQHIQVIIRKQQGDEDINRHYQLVVLPELQLEAWSGIYITRTYMIPGAGENWIDNGLWSIPKTGS